jgi:hypothetical protein
MQRRSVTEVPMPRYYLHLRNGHVLEKDPDGIDLPNIEAARAEALRVFR